MSQTCDFPGVPHPSGMWLPHRLVTSGPLSAASLVGVDELPWARAEPLSRRPHAGCAQVGLLKSFPGDDEDDNDGSGDTKTRQTYPPPR